MNNKVLFGIFAVLLLFYAGSKLFKGNQQSSFDPQVVLVDTAQIEQIRIYPKGAPEQSFTLDRNAGGWIAKNNSMEVDAVESAVNSLLSQLNSIRARRVVSKSPEKWAGYEVEESSGTRVVVNGGGESLADFIVGAFKFDQTSQSASSYIRKTGNDEVYVVDGFLAMSFNQQFNNFRDKTILIATASDLTAIRLIEGAETETFQKVSDAWYYAGMEAVDSSLMTGYLQGLAAVNGFEFANAFQPTGSPAIQQLEIEGNNLMENIRITAYKSGEEEKPFVIHSSVNPEAYFLSDSTGVWDRLFGKLQALRPGSTR